MPVVHRVCSRCGQSLYADVSEDEFKRSGHKYRAVDTSRMSKMSDEDAAQ